MATLSSIITPTNITTASNTQTLTNKTITGGILNGTLGATTPSTVAATLLNVAASTRPTITVETTGVTAKGRVFHADANAGGRLDLSSNLSFDGTNWQRDDTGQPSSIISLTGGLFQWRRANTGSNPASLTTILSGSDAGLAVTGTGSYSGLLTTSAGVTNTAVSIKSTKTYGPVYEATEDNTDNTGRGIFNIYRSTTLVGQIVTTNTTCAYNNVSDYRLKEITGPLVDSGIFIDALKPRMGTWKTDGSKFVGFLAHEFAEVSPISVTGEKDAVDADGKAVMQSMQASTPEVMANIVAELQSLRKRLAALEAK